MENAEAEYAIRMVKSLGGRPLHGPISARLKWAEPIRAVLVRHYADKGRKQLIETVTAEFGPPPSKRAAEGCLGLIVGMHPGAVGRARRVMAAAQGGDPELAALVRRMDLTGTVPADRMKTLLRKEEEDPEPFVIETKRDEVLARAAHHRVAVMVSSLEGYVDGLEGEPGLIQRALALATDEERRRWLKGTRKVLKGLTVLRKTLENGGNGGQAE
jgi:hypothetical protein